MAAALAGLGQHRRNGFPAEPSPRGWFTELCANTVLVILKQERKGWSCMHCNRWLSHKLIPKAGRHCYNKSLNYTVWLWSWVVNSCWENSNEMAGKLGKKKKSPVICRERKRKTIAWCSLGDKDVPNHLCFGEGGFFSNWVPLLFGARKFCHRTGGKELSHALGDFSRILGFCSEVLVPQGHECRPFTLF